MRNLFFILGIFVSFSALSQNYYFNQLRLNPAFAGAKGGLSATAVLGKQFTNTATGGIGSIGGITGGSGTSVNQLFSADGLLAGGSLGFGVQISKSQLGYSANTEGNMSMAYRLASDGNLLSLGVQGGFVYLPIFDLTTQTAVNKITPNAGLGGLMVIENMFISVSKPIWYQKEVQISKDNTLETASPLYVYGGYSYPYNDELRLNGAVMFEKQQGVTPNIDLSVRGWYKEKYSAGVLTRFGDTNNLIPFAEYQLGKFRFGAAYDSKPYGSSQQSFQRGVFQFMLRYESIGENPTIMRYF